MDLKPDPIGVGMLSEPLIRPASPTPPGLEMNKVVGLWICFKDPMARTEIAVGEDQRLNGGPTVRAVNSRPEDGVGDTDGHSL